MSGISRLSLWVLISLLVLLGSCQQQINYPAPVIATIAPLSMPAGQPAFTLTVTGSGFTPSSTVEWNGSGRNTLFSTTGQLTAQILASDIQNAGTAFVQVTTPTPGGGTTQPITFTITPIASPVPQITSLSPSGVSTGSSGFTLFITGKNFGSSSAVSVNGSNRTTGFISSTSLAVNIDATDIANAGALPIIVVNPQPNGGSSNPFLLSVTNPVPAITSLTPGSVTAGGAATLLTLTGLGYVPNSVVNINGAPRTTSFSSSTSIAVLLSAGDLAVGGLAQITVVNPAPGGGTSNIALVAVNPTDSAGLPILVDLAPDGTQANNGICGASCTGGTPTLATAGPSVSNTGEFVAFASISTNLLANTTTATSDIFLRDTCLGVAGSTGSGGCIPKTSLINLSASGGAADGPSSEPSVDSAGSHVAYTSTASNLVNYVNVPGGTRQVYWQPACPAATNCLNSPPVLVSVGSNGITPGNGESFNPVISADGQYVAFVSLATNLVTGASPNGVTPQVYIRNTCNGIIPSTQVVGGCIPITYLVSSPDGSTPGNGPSAHPAIANTGAFVSYVSSSTNLGATAPNPNGTQEIFEQNECLGVAGCAQVTSLISTFDGVTPADHASIQPSMSPDGRFVAFASTATNLGIAPGGVQEIYLRDTCTGVAVSTPATCTPSISLVSTTNGTTPANALSENPSVNQCSATSTCATGLIVAFASNATNLGSTLNGIENIFVRETCQGLASTTTACTASTALASVPAGTLPAAANGSSVAPAISGDGHTVSFISSATNLVAHDNNGFADIFLAATSY